MITINKNKPIAFGAKVFMDLRCRKYYENCPSFRETVDTIEKEVEAEEVDILAAHNSNWHDTREIYALSEHIDGNMISRNIGLIDEGSHERGGAMKFFDTFDEQAQKFYTSQGSYYNFILYEKMKKY